VGQVFVNVPRPSRASWRMSAGSVSDGALPKDNQALRLYQDHARCGFDHRRQNLKEQERVQNCEQMAVKCLEILWP